MSRLLNGERKKKILAKIEEATRGYKADQIIYFLQSKLAINHVCAGFDDDLVMEVLKEKFKYLSTYSTLFLERK